MAAFRVFLIALALTAPVWALHATSVSACSCAGYSNTLEQRLQAADIVVLGRVSELRVVEELPSRTPRFDPDSGEEIQDWRQGIDVVSVFQVDELLRGAAPNPLEIYSYTDVVFGPGDEVLVSAGGSGDCGFAFTLNARYLMYYSEPLPDPLQASYCARNWVSIQDDDQLPEFRQLLQQVPPEPTVAAFPAGGSGTTTSGGSSAWPIALAASGALVLLSGAAILLRRRPS